MYPFLQKLTGTHRFRQRVKNNFLFSSSKKIGFHGKERPPKGGYSLSKYYTPNDICTQEIDFSFPFDNKRVVFLRVESNLNFPLKVRKLVASFNLIKKSRKESITIYIKIESGQRGKSLNKIGRGRRKPSTRSFFFSSPLRTEKDLSFTFFKRLVLTDSILQNSSFESGKFFSPLPPFFSYLFIKFILFILFCSFFYFSRSVHKLCWLPGLKQYSTVQPRLCVWTSKINNGWTQFNSTRVIYDVTSEQPLK